MLPAPASISRLEWFKEVDSTQRIVRDWLDAGVPEVVVAAADVQTGGRGRHGRGWWAPPGRGLLVSCGFRPPVLLRHGWRLGAVAALAMIDAAEDVAGLRDGTLWLKWPNDLVAEGVDGQLRKVAGVLGEAVASDDRVATAVVGIGVNADWPSAEFPPELAAVMTSLRELSGGRPTDRKELLDAYLSRLEMRYEALRRGRFDSGGWSMRQRTTGRRVEVVTGSERLDGAAVGVDPDTGGLIVDVRGGTRTVDSGEVVRCRILELPIARQRGRNG